MLVFCSCIYMKESMNVGHSFVLFCQYVSHHLLCGCKHYEVNI